jgi:hypothetical protein
MGCVSLCILILIYWANINIIEKKTEALLHTGMELGLEVNVEKTRYMFVCHHQNAGQNPNIKLNNKSFKTVAKCKCMKMTVANQNYDHEEINSRLNLGNACYQSLESFLFSSPI